MKRILFIIRTLNMGGAEHVLVDIVNRMAMDGYSVEVQTLQDEGYYREHLCSKVIYRRGIRGSALTQRIIMKLLHILPACISANMIIGRGYSHIVAFAEGLPTKIVSGYSKEHVKKLAWVHTDLFANYSLSKYVFGNEKKNRDCYLLYDHIVCVSNDALRGFVKRIGPHRSIMAQYNPLNKMEIIERSRVNAAYQLNEDDVFRIVAVGRLETVKGFDILIEAITIVNQCVRKPVSIYIVGGGSQEEALKCQIEKNGLNDIVHLCGQQKNPYSIMSKCDLQVISSRAEGYSLALCEGHFLGLPVVATKCSGPIEILGVSKGGILVDISSEALAAGIVQMVNDEALFAVCKENALNWSGGYDADVVYKQIESIFD